MIVSGPGDADDVTSGICSLVLSAVMDAWRAAAPICTTGMGCGCDVSPCKGWAILGCVRAEVATSGPCVPREVRDWGTCVAGRDRDAWADECDRVVTIGVGRLCTSWCTWGDRVAWMEVCGLGERVLSHGWALVCLLLDTKLNSCSPSSRADSRESVMPTNFDFNRSYLSGMPFAHVVWVALSPLTLFCALVYLRIPESLEASFFNLSFSFNNFLISHFWFLSVFFRLSISDIKSSTWCWSDNLSSLSAWSSISDATSFASIRTNKSSFGSVWFSAWEASMSVRLWSETSMSTSLSLISSLGDGIGVTSLDLGVVIFVLSESFLHARLSLALFLCLFLSARVILFGLWLPRTGKLDASWVCLLGLPCPGGGVDIDCSPSGERNPVMLLCTMTKSLWGGA